MDPIQLLRASGRRLAVVYSRDLDIPLVYVLHRVGSPAFLRLATLALAASSSSAADADELQSRLLGARTDEERERVVAEHAATKEARAAGEMGAIVQDPSRIEALIGGANELVMAGVAAVGIGRTDIELEYGLQPLSTEARDICQPVTSTADSKEPVYLRPIRWSGGGKMDVDQMSVTELREEDRLELAQLIAEAFTPTTAARSFPGSGAAGGRGPLGEQVRPKTKRASAHGRSARGSDRSGGDGGR